MNTGELIMLRCDEEGIPKLVQHITYDDMAWRLKLFSGQTVWIDDDIGYPRGVQPMDTETLIDIEQRFIDQIHPRINYTDIHDAPKVSTNRF